jgi:hypothetical protein
MGKGSAKLRSLQRKLHPDTKGWSMKPTSLQGIANKAASDKGHRFRNLFGLLSVEFLLWCWQFVNKRAVSGVDREDARSYQENLRENIEGLVEAVQGGWYRAKLVLRRYIPKLNGKLRPLGIPAIADKLLQIGVTKILEAIYEQDFLGCSYGYRPGVGALDAVRDLSAELRSGRYHYLVEADIRGFFDNLDQEKLLEMLELRIDDKAFLKVIRKWLKAGILEPDGTVNYPEKGSPQGGIVTPPTMLQKRVVSTRKRTISNAEYHVNAFVVNFNAFDPAILILAHVKDLRSPNCAISEPLTQHLRPPLASELSLLPIGVPSHFSTQRYCRFQNEPPP